MNRKIFRQRKRVGDWGRGGGEGLLIVFEDSANRHAHTHKLTHDTCVHNVADA